MRHAVFTKPSCGIAAIYRKMGVHFWWVFDVHLHTGFPTSDERNPIHACMEKVFSSVSSLPYYYRGELEMKMTVADRTTGAEIENGQRIADLMQTMFEAASGSTVPLLMFHLELQAGARGKDTVSVRLDGILSEAAVYSISRTKRDKKRAKNALIELLNLMGENLIDLKSAQWVTVRLAAVLHGGRTQDEFTLYKDEAGTWQLPDNWLGETDKPPGWFSRMLISAWEWINRQKAG